MGEPGQGIVHVIGPEQGLTQPGMTIVCGDSHTSTHGAFGALAFGIGTSEVEHVLATQTLPQAKPKTMAITVDGELPAGVTAKDVILAIIGNIGTGGGIGSIIEYRGSAIRALSMEGRMTICNMSIEAGARAGMVAPDDTTFAYLEGRESRRRARPGSGRSTTGGRCHRRRRDLRPRGRARRRRDRVRMSRGARTRRSRSTSTTSCPVPTLDDAEARDAAKRALVYMGLEPGTPMRDIPVDTVFIGSCTNARIEDLRAAAAVVARTAPSAGMRAMVVPGSMAVKAAGGGRGSRPVFEDAGFEWRGPGARCAWR